MKRTLLGILIIGLVISLGMLSCGKKEQKEIELGAMLPLTGDYAPWGERSQRALELALEEINKETIRGSKIRIIYEDSPGNPQKAVSAFHKLVELDKVKFILGPLSSAEVLAIAPIAEKEKIIILTPVSSAPQITHAGDYIFRNCVSDVFEGTVAAEFIFESLHKSKIGIFFLNNDFGIGVKDTVKKRLSYLGGETLIEEAFNAGDTDFRTQLFKISSKNPEVVVLIGYAVEMGEILRQARELKIKPLFVSFSSFEAPEVLKLAGEAAEGVYYTYQGFDSKSDEAAVDTFVQNYRSKYSEEPDIFAALSYDALRIYAEAFKRGGTDVESTKKALYGIKEFVGVVGKTSFDENGDVIKPIGIKMVKGGKFVWVEREFEIR